MNWMSWTSFFGQCLLAFLTVEGTKSVIFGLRTPARSWWRVGLNLAMGALFAYYAVLGSTLFPYTKGWIVVAIIVGALVTAGLHRVVKRFRPGAVAA
jgi:hypothetical protein